MQQSFSHLLYPSLFLFEVTLGLVNQLRFYLGREYEFPILTVAALLQVSLYFQNAD